MKFTGFVFAILPLLTAAHDFQIVQWDCVNPITGTGDVTRVVRHGDESGCDGCKFEKDDDDNWVITNTEADGCDYEFKADKEMHSFSIGDGREGSCTDNTVADVCQTASVSCALVIDRNCDFD